MGIKTQSKFASYGADGELIALVAEGLPDWPSDITTLSDEQDGASAVADATGKLGENDWVPGGDVHGWMGWNGLAFSGQAVRYHVKFPCLSKDSKLEFTYRVWPFGKDEEKDGKEEEEDEEDEDEEALDEKEGGSASAPLWAAMRAAASACARAMVSRRARRPAASGSCSA